MKPLPLHKRIPFRLSAILTGILLLLAALAQVPVHHRTLQRITDAVNHTQLSKAQHYAHEIEVKFHERSTFIANLAAAIPAARLQDGGGIDLLLQRANTLVNFFPLGIGIIHPDGQRLIGKHSLLPGLEELTFEQSPWFNRAKQEHGVVISRPFRARNTGEPVIVLATAIRDPGGACAGVLASPIRLDAPDLLGFAYEESQTLFAGTLIISRPDKTIVAASDPAQVLRPLPEPGAIPMQDKAMAGFSGVGTTVNETGTQDIAAVANIPSLDWYVVIRTPASLALTPVREEIMSNITTSCLLILAVVATVFFTLTLYFRPLEHASKTIRAMDKDQALPTFPQARNDEIGDLFSGFNALVGTVNERTAALREANGRLEALAQTDALTGVCNRRRFDESLERLWRAHQRSGEPLSLIILDIDFFKQFNDNQGHLRGDECLIAVARALSGTLKRPTDVFARYGGEEFGVIVENDAPGALQFAEAMRRTVEELGIGHPDSPYGIVTISLGVATLSPRPGSAQDTLIAQADKALYASKEAGRNRVNASEAGGGGGAEGV